MKTIPEIISKELLQSNRIYCVYLSGSGNSICIQVGVVTGEIKVLLTTLLTPEGTRSLPVSPSIPQLLNPIAARNASLFTVFPLANTSEICYPFLSCLIRSIASPAITKRLAVAVSKEKRRIFANSWFAALYSRNLSVKCSYWERWRKLLNGRKWEKIRRECGEDIDSKFALKWVRCDGFLVKP